MGRPNRHPRSTTGRTLRGGAGIVFTALLVWAPLNFGSARQGGIRILCWTCVVATLLWAASLFLERTRPKIPWLAAAASALLILAVMPWLTHGLAPTKVDPFTVTHFDQVAVKFPNGILWRTPAEDLFLTVALGAAILALIDLASSRTWALAFSSAIVLTATFVAALALLQNYTGATGIYWRHDGRMPGNFCGTFFHHTSAGAYFNTAWPLAFAFTFLIGASPVLAGLAGVSTVLIVAGHSSHVSRFPQVAAALVAPFLLASVRVRGARTWLLILAGLLFLALLIMIGGRTDTIAARWHLMVAGPPAPVQLTAPPESAWPKLMRDDLFVPFTSHPGLLGDRAESWRAALRSIAQRPVFGHGPGNWMGAVSQTSQDPFVRTFYQFLQFTHEDYLQFAVELGIPAALAWCTLLVGGIVGVIRKRKSLPLAFRAIGVASACGLAAVLLQSLLDFPLQIPAVLLNAVVLAALCWAASASTAAAQPTLSVE